MARVQIDFPADKTIFKTTIPVLINHLNYGNHLAHDSLLSILQEARIQFLKHHSMGELTVDTDIGLLVIDVVVAYKSEAFHGDQLEVMLGVVDITRTSCDFVYKVFNKTSNKIVAIAKTGICFYDVKKKKVANIPAVFLKAISR